MDIDHSHNAQIDYEMNEYEVNNAVKLDFRIYSYCEILGRSFAFTQSMDD